MKRLKGLYVLNTNAYDWIYGPEERADIADIVEIYASQQTKETVLAQPDILTEADVIFSGWGMVSLDEALLAHMPHLKMVFYGAGSIRGFVTDASWACGIRVTTAAAANAVPVSEYALATILFSLKHGWQLAAHVRQEHRYPTRPPVPGAYGSTIGLISLGMVGRLVRERLRPFDVRVIAYDPYVSEASARALGVTLVSLEELFRTADVVSLHTPLMEETRNMIQGHHLAAMKEGATFINTARGAVVHEEEMISVLKQRPDLQAVLDVTYSEPPASDSPLYMLPNVVLTPHIAGSQWNECRRMGRYMVEELRRYIAGEPLHWEVTQEQAERMA